MRLILAVSAVALMVSLAALAVCAQQASNPPFDFPKHGIEPPENDWYRDMIRNMKREEKSGPSPEPRVIKKGPLAPYAEDRARYAAFLTQPDAGLMRLLPRTFNQPQKSANGVMIDAGTARDTKGSKGGSYFSFSFLSHEYGYGSDLELSTTLRFNGSTPLPPLYEFAVGFAGADYGMMTNIDEVELEKITAEDPRTHFVLAYEPPRSEPTARCEALAFRKGVSVDGQFYQRSLPVQVNATYLLRSINYGVSDVAVAFHVARQDSDGSVTLAWKLLKHFPPRKLENVLYVQNIDKCPIR